METRVFSVAAFAEMDTFFRRNLINCLSGFKSLNLVGTVSAAGVENIAPFSQVFHIGASPALMGLLIRPDSVERHTLNNLLETGSYTFNHVREDFYRQAHQSAARYQTSEFAATGLSPEYRAGTIAPYLREASVKIGLKFEERHDLAVNGTILIIGSIQEIIVPAAIVGADGFLDIEKAGSITCAGLDAYYRTQKIARLSYAKPDRELTELD